jgi:hypothetical protein
VVAKSDTERALLEAIRAAARGADPPPAASLRTQGARPRGSTLPTTPSSPCAWSGTPGSRFRVGEIVQFGSVLGVLSPSCAERVRSEHVASSAGMVSANATDGASGPNKVVDGHACHAAQAAEPVPRTNSSSELRSARDRRVPLRAGGAVALLNVVVRSHAAELEPRLRPWHQPRSGHSRRPASGRPADESRGAAGSATRCARRREQARVAPTLRQADSGQCRHDAECGNARRRGRARGNARRASARRGGRTRRRAGIARARCRPAHCGRRPALGTRAR